MTPGSMLLALIVSLLTPLLIGVLGKVLKLNAQAVGAWAMAGGFALAFSLLLAGNSQQYFRWLTPREAMDWLPGLALALAAIETVGQVTKESRPQVSKLAKWFGGLVCVLAAFRLLYGSVFLRPGHIDPLACAVIITWGLAIAISWTVNAYLKFETTDNVKARPNWSQVILVVLGLSSVAIANGMSGSFTYGTLGGVIAICTFATILATGHLPAASGALALSMIGLGHAFAELAITAAVAMGLALVTLLVSRHVENRRARLIIVTLSLMLMLVSGNMVARQFLSTLTAKPETNGYEAYK